VKRQRTTHSDMAQLLLDHEERLAQIKPLAGNGPIVSDASTRELIRAAAAALLDQDEQISTLIVSLREARDRLKTVYRGDAVR
jgi:ABC-type transporter Mla subunit MlaD